MPTNFKVKIAIAEDCKITRDLLKGHLQDVPELSVIIEAPNGKMLLEKIAKHTPHVAIIDVRMDLMDGIEAAHEIRKINPDIKVIAWSSFSDLHTILKMLDAGARAFLDKEVELQELKKCICSVYKEGYYYNQYFTRTIHESILRGDNHFLYRAGEVVLEDDELELTKKVCTGWNNKRIADENSVSVRKVQKDVTKLMEKTHTDSIPELVTYAYRNGIISLKEER